MIRLTTDQIAELDNGSTPPEVVNPITGECYILLRKDVYERVRQLVSETNDRADWDDPAFDVYQ